MPIDCKKAFNLFYLRILLQKISQLLNFSWVCVWSLPTIVTENGTFVLGPCLFLLMFNELRFPSTNKWKYVDDTTVGEVVYKRKLQHQPKRRCHYEGLNTQIQITTINAEKYKEMINYTFFWLDNRGRKGISRCLPFLERLFPTPYCGIIILTMSWESPAYIRCRYLLLHLH